MTDYTTKVAELQADVQTIWKLQCQNLYNSKNLGALAVRESVQNSLDAIGKRHTFILTLTAKSWLFPIMV